MANVLHRTTKDFLQSVNTPDFPSGTYAINPAGTAALLTAGVPTKYWKLTGAHPAETASEMNAGEKAAVDDDPTTLAALKVVRLAEIDGATQDIIAEGFLHDSKIFGLATVDVSNFAQWREKIQQGTDTYAKLWVLKDGTSYSIASRVDFLQIFATYMEALEAAHTGGLTLRSDIADAVDDAAVDAVVDGRTVEKYTPGGTPERGPFDSAIPLLSDWTAGEFNLRAAGFSAGAAIDPSAILTLVSTTKGFLPPSMTTTQRDAIGSAAAGLIIWNSTTGQHERYSGATWDALGGGGGGGDLKADGSVPLTAPWNVGDFSVHPDTDGGGDLGLPTAVWGTAWVRNVRPDASQVFHILDSNGVSALDVLTSGVTINESGIDKDFRVESNDDLLALFVDGSTNRIGMGALSVGRVAKLSIVQLETTGAIPVLSLTQNDISEPMIQLACTIGTGNGIEAVAAKSLTATHFVKVKIPGGLTRYIETGTIA